MSTPLAHLLRPTKLDDMVGQEHLLQENSPFRKALNRTTANSYLFWGPPGCGKTTLAKLVAQYIEREFLELSAVSDGLPKLRSCIEIAQSNRQFGGNGAVLFVDEIHRWNKSQQDALLPHVESGLICLIGATTENPYHSINKALRSRCWTLELYPLGTVDLCRVLKKGLDHLEMDAEDGVVEKIADFASGDARRALSLLEQASPLAQKDLLSLESLQHFIHRDLLHDATGDAHYDVTSALIKSMRGSDPDASLYWLARMIAGGEDPMFIARRLVIFASEDIGNADLRALPIATACLTAIEKIGLPEGELILGHTCTYLACAPKSNASKIAIRQAMQFVQNYGHAPVPKNIAQHHIGYKNPHDFPNGIVDQPYWPPTVKPTRFYSPKPIGDEDVIRKRLAWWAQKKKSE